MRVGKRLLLLLLALAVILLSLSGRAFAAGEVDVEAEVAMTVIFAPEGTPVRGVEFRLYPVAELSRTGVYTSLDGWPSLPERDTAEAWRQYASVLKEHVAAEEILPMETISTDRRGEARAEGLSPGLYLVTGEGYQGDDVYISPAAFLVSLPRLDETDVWQYDVIVNAKYESIPTGGRLPQTGLVRWPVPVLLGCGLITLVAGAYLRRKGDEK